MWGGSWLCGYGMCVCVCSGYEGGERDGRCRVGICAMDGWVNEGRKEGLYFIGGGCLFM